MILIAGLTLAYEMKPRDPDNRYTDTTLPDVWQGKISRIEQRGAKAMDLKQLVYLCNLEREKHFGRAAEASFVSQPTLSLRLKNLEKELGVSLINRSNNFSGFTPEGERVLSWAREIVSVYQGLKLEVDAMKHGMQGTLRIGVVPQCSMSLSGVLQAVSRHYPEINYRIDVMSADQLLEAINSHTVDVAFGFFEMSTLRELQFQDALFPDQGVVALYCGNAFELPDNESPVSLAKIAEFPLCLAAQTRYFRRYLDNSFRQAGVPFRVIIESSSVLQLLESAHQGIGIMLAPSGNVLPAMLGELSQVVVDIPKMTRQGAMVIAGSSRATPLTQHFFDEARLLLPSLNSF